MDHITLLNRKSLRLAELASKDESRYVLKAIQITAEETVVTDGHLLVRVSHPAGIDAKQFPMTAGFDGGKEFESVLLPAASAAEITKAIPTKSKIPILNHVALAVTQNEDGAKLKFAVNDLENPKVFQPKAMAGQFPAWKRIMPTKAPKFTFTVNPTLLLSLCKYATEFTKGERMPAMRMSFEDANSAVRIDLESSDTQQGMTALLMPMRSGNTYPHCLPMPEAEVIADPFACVAADGTLVDESSAVGASQS